MKILLTIKMKDMSIDYQVSSDMQIKRALCIISENDELVIPEDVEYVFSKRRQQMISVNQSFYQASIYSGDSITLCWTGGGKNNE